MILSGASQTEAVQKTAAPQSNDYPQASKNIQNTLKQQTGMLGHNTFRPDIYRVTEGYLS